MHTEAFVRQGFPGLTTENFTKAKNSLLETKSCQTIKIQDGTNDQLNFLRKKSEHTVKNNTE